VAGVILFVLCAAPPSVTAQADWDPGGAVAAYSAALNAHDLASALALFDDYGSASDRSGRNYAGRAGLTEFLLGSGFGNPQAQITTRSLIVVANRAIWTYTCSCAAGPTDVRMVMNHDKISVFDVVAPHPPAFRRADAGALPWLIGLGLVAGALAGGLGLRRGRVPAPVPRASQGRLLAGLAQAHAARGYTPGGAASDRVELPAAAMTSFNSSEDSAGPWSLYRKHEAARPGSR
jgi:SnoaL-like domain